MQALNEGTFTFMGLRMVDIFFKVNPEKLGTVEDVRMERIACPSCKESSLDVWGYLENGSWQIDKVWPICLECQKTDVSRQATKKLLDKQREVIEGDWYHIDPDDTSGFKNFEVIDEATEVAKAKATAYTRAIIEGNVGNLRIAGSPGTGKTHLAIAVARTAKHSGVNVAFVEAKTLFKMIKATFGNDHERKRLDKHFGSFDLMIIDDVGLETKKRDEVSWTSTEWVDLIDMRKGKSTVYTTNFDAESLRKVIGARAESRMKTNADSIELFTGKDQRK